jgi:Kef-type K+ transport system membrane component KefB
VSVARDQLGSAVATVGLTAVYLCFMLFAARPMVRRWIEHFGIRRAPGREGMAVVCVGLLLSSLCTEWIGIHAIFGAFLLGAIIPHDSELARDLTRRLEDFVVVLLLPAYFAFTGMRTEIGLVSGTSQLLLCGLLVLVASAGKFGGCMLAGRSVGMGWRDSASIGTLMNTRGLMELVVLNIGFDLGVISAPLFAMLVLMAIITTLMTTPVLHFITRGDTSLASAHSLEPSRN